MEGRCEVKPACGWDDDDDDATASAEHARKEIALVSALPIKKKWHATRADDDEHEWPMRAGHNGRVTRPDGNEEGRPVEGSGGETFERTAMEVEEF